MIGMKLAEYLSNNGLTQKAFGDRIKTSQVAVNRYLTGRRVPEPDVMERIIAATCGDVTANDFFDIETLTAPAVREEVHEDAA